MIDHDTNSRVGVARLVQVFVDAVKSARNIVEVHSLLGDFTAEIGIEYFALMQHTSDARTRGIQLSNYPDGWIETMTDRGLFSHDPVLVMAQRTVAPFEWHELPKLLAMSEAQKGTLAASARHGIHNGFTIPLHVPGEPLGLCSFALAGRDEYAPIAKPTAQYAACFAFEAARRLARERRDTSVAPQLTQRQLDCLVLLAQGKSESVAAQLLGLSPRTVHKYMEHAKGRYDVATRSQLIVRALFDGAISYADIL